jgi:phosphoribosylanthranilate isomerase
MPRDLPVCAGIAADDSDEAMRTRIKICGITRAEHAAAAAAAGADAIGLVFYRPSPRRLELDQAAEIAAAAGPFVARVAVFVNPSVAEVARVIERMPIELLQFHGEEEPEFCVQFARPYLKAARVLPGLDLIKYFARYGEAAGWLVDAFRDREYGGTGERFDWSLIPARSARPLVLSGGLRAENVAQAVRRVRPWALDVSTGVESAKGHKDPSLVRQFIDAVRRADAEILATRTPTGAPQ